LQKAKKNAVGGEKFSAVGAKKDPAFYQNTSKQLFAKAKRAFFFAERALFMP
jgi:hypothetical protein